MKYKISVAILAVMVLFAWVISIPKYHEKNIYSKTKSTTGDPQRIITTDWTTGETLLALNAPLVGIGDKSEYAIWVESPTIGHDVADLGLRSQPNLEVIANIKPTIYISSAWSQGLIPSHIIQVKFAAIDFYPQAGISWHTAVTTTQQLAELVDRKKEANRLIDNTKQSFEKNAKRLISKSGQPVAVIQFIDARHMRIYGGNSLYGVVLDQLHLNNVWHTSANAWGFDQISLLDLALLPQNAMLIIVKPYPTDIYRQLAKNKLWQTLPFSDPKQYRILPAVWAFGALPSMQRFSDTLTEALTGSTMVSMPSTSTTPSSIPTQTTAAENKG